MKTEKKKLILPLSEYRTDLDREHHRGYTAAINDVLEFFTTGKTNGLEEAQRYEELEKIHASLSLRQEEGEA